MSTSEQKLYNWLKLNDFHSNINHSSQAYSGLTFAINICYLPAGRSVLGKTVPEVLRSARGRRLENYFIRNIFVDFLLQQFHTMHMCLTFRSSKPVLFTEVFKRRDSVFADFKLRNK